MIDRVLIYFRDSLNTYLKATLDESESKEDRAVFLDGDKVDPIVFSSEAVSVLLINVEEEKIMRPADMYRRLDEKGNMVNILPDIRLNLYVLFVAKFKQYTTALEYISSVIKYFQSNKIITQENAPTLAQLDSSIEKITVELVTMPFTEQNEIWNALRTTYHPSVLYRIKPVQYIDDNPELARQGKEIDVSPKQS